MDDVGIARDSLAAQVRNAIIDLIDAEGLDAGAALPSTAALSERFRVSRPVVREALSALQAMGLIELSNGRNAVVRELDGHLIALFLGRALRRSRRPLADLMEVRAPLEIQAAALAAIRADAREAADLVAHADDMAGRADDAERYVALDLELHRRIAVLSGNEALLWVVDAARERIWRTMTALRAYREEHGLVGTERDAHARIVRAIAAGDAAGAEAAMREHMRETTDLVAAVEG